MSYPIEYPHDSIFREVKGLILPTIINRINPNDIVKTRLQREVLAEIIFTKIMALAYNKRDLNAAANDLMPTRNPIIYSGPDETDAVNMVMRLSIICEDYLLQLSAFEIFHKMTQENQSREEIIKNVKKQILTLMI